MPIYEYRCQKCHEHHEIMQKITDKPLTKCPSCGGRLKKMISNTSFVLKGTGWYATDYASDKDKKSAKSKKQEKAAAKTESKSETGTGNKAEPAKTAASE